MSEEEKKAIDLFKEILDVRSCLISDDIGENDIKTVLNLIQKQKENINKLIRYIAIKESKDFEEVQKEFEI